MAANSNSQKRQLRNFLISPGSQLKIAFGIILFGLLTIVGSVVYFLYSMNTIFENLASMYQMDLDIVTSLKQSLLSTGVLTAGLGAIFTLVTLAFIVVLTHRIIGPAVPIRRMILELQNGNYAVRGKLRERDEYKEVMEALNDLAKSLEKAHGTGSSGGPKLIEREG